MKLLKKLGKILIELFLIVLIAVVTTIGVLFALKAIQNANNFDAIAGSIKRQEIVVSSPVFGTIESLNLHQGDSVKKGDVIARIVFVQNQDQNADLITSNIFRFDNKGVDVISPENGVVSSVLLSQGSIIKPQTDFVVIYPFSDTLVELSLPDNNSSINDYSDFEVSNSGQNIPLKLLNSLPVSGTEKTGRFYYATFENEADSENFYNKESVSVRATRKQVNNTYFSNLINQILGFFKKV